MRTVNQGMTHRHIVLFRGLFIAVLLAVSYLAFAPADYTVMGRINDKVSHVGAFFILAMLADFSFPLSRFGWHKIWPLLLFALLIEIIQYFLQSRIFSIYDLLSSVLGISLYACSPPLLRHLPLIQIRWR